MKIPELAGVSAKTFLDRADPAIRDQAHLRDAAIREPNAQLPFAARPRQSIFELNQDLAQHAHPFPLKADLARQIGCAPSLSRGGGELTSPVGMGRGTIF